jgi:hypothetical protein
MMPWLEFPARRSMWSAPGQWDPGMSSISPVNTTALLILQQPRALAGSADNDPAGISGISGLLGSGSPFAQAPAKISDAMFSVNSVDPTEMKVRLIERLGKEFGIEPSDYKSMADYGADIKRAVDALKAKPGSAMAIIAIEKKLGLDKLGISLDDLVGATIDPNGDASKKVDAALRKQAGEMGKSQGGSLQSDEIGIYGR